MLPTVTRGRYDLLYMYHLWPKKTCFGSLASAETVGQAASHTELHGAPVFSLMAGGRLCVVEVSLLSMLGLEFS